MPERLFDCLTLFGRARDDPTTPTGTVRRSARRQAPKRLDMSDPTGFRDEAVMTLNDILYLALGRHPNPRSEKPSGETGPGRIIDRGRPPSAHRAD